MPIKHPIRQLPSTKYLRQCFTYAPMTGELRWKKRPRGHFSIKRIWALFNTRDAGTIAGCIVPDGYRDVGLCLAVWPAHRLIWKLVTGKEPPLTIDHIDGDRANNRWANLRPATKTRQSWNSGLRKNNTSGQRGVRFQANGKPYATITANGQRRHLGTFNTIEEASAAYEAAARELHGEFYRSP